MTKYCKECGKLNENPFHKLCYKHSKGSGSFSSSSTRLKPSALKKQSDRKILRKKIEGKETDVFDKVYEYHKGRCILTGNPVSNSGVECYPHILPKGIYPKLRLFENNIVLVGSGELHEKLDEIVTQIINDIGSKELEKLIKTGGRIDQMIRDRIL